ncbi:hypothetical protein FQN57_006071 [Myotisia sp. PD_48]|nr:hypothetical protein FQN57_006071 [Myotisia sp. PD_48]
MERPNPNQSVDPFEILPTDGKGKPHFLDHRDPKNFSRPFPSPPGSQQVNVNRKNHVRFESAGSSGENLISPAQDSATSFLSFTSNYSASRTTISPISPGSNGLGKGFWDSHRYTGDPSRAASRLGLGFHRTRPTSFVSFTPTDLPGMPGCQPMSYGQLKEICRVAEENGVGMPPEVPDQASGEFCSEPPDGGFLAWAHAVSGFFVCMNTFHAIERAGFKWTVRIILLVYIITMVPVNFIVRERPGTRKASGASLDRTMFKDIPYLIMAAGMFFSFWGVYFGFYFVCFTTTIEILGTLLNETNNLAKQISSFGQDILHMTPQSSLNLLVAMNATNMVGRLIPGLISDACIGPLNTVIPTVFVAAIMAFLWTGVTTQGSLFLVGCFYGFSAAGIQSLYIATVFSFVGERTNAPSRVGVVFLLISLATLTGAPLGGQLIVLNKGEYFYAEIFAGISLLLGGVLFLTARLVKRGWGPEKI